MKPLLRAEQSVLGAVLLDPGQLASLAWLEPGHFYRPAHRALFDAMRAAPRRPARTGRQGQRPAGVGDRHRGQGGPQHPWPEPELRAHADRGLPPPRARRDVRTDGAGGRDPPHGDRARRTPAQGRPRRRPPGRGRRRAPPGRRPGRRARRPRPPLGNGAPPRRTRRFADGRGRTRSSCHRAGAPGRAVPALHTGEPACGDERGRRLAAARRLRRVRPRPALPLPGRCTIAANRSTSSPCSGRPNGAACWRRARSPTSRCTASARVSASARPSSSVSRSCVPR